MEPTGSDATQIDEMIGILSTMHTRNAIKVTLTEERGGKARPQAERTDIVSTLWKRVLA